MPDSTLTAPFTLTIHGATAEVVTNKTVAIPQEIRDALKAARSWFATQPNTQKISFNFPDETTAAEFTAQVAAYAEGSRGQITASFPHWSGAHANVKVTGADGKSEYHTVTPTKGSELMSKLAAKVPATDKTAVTVVKHEKDDTKRGIKKGDVKKFTVKLSGVETVINFVADNLVPKNFNEGTNVTFRFSPVKIKDETKTSGPVTVTHVEPAPATA
jgi:predicted lipid-binding transport protein (Tim44 family)